MVWIPMSSNSKPWLKANHIVDSSRCVQTIISTEEDKDAKEIHEDSIIQLSAEIYAKAGTTT